MKFAFIPKAEYHLGQEIDVPGHGKMQVDSYRLDMRSLIAVTLEEPYRYVKCICTDEKPIEEIKP